jgi:hypothetical protein
VSWEHYNDFFPNNTSFDIIDIMNLIKDNLSPQKHAERVERIYQQLAKVLTEKNP